MFLREFFEEFDMVSKFYYLLPEEAETNELSLLSLTSPKGLTVVKDSLAADVLPSLTPCNPELLELNEESILLILRFD